MSDITADADAVVAAAAIVHIQQLAIRYAVKVDQRDIEGVAQLYSEDIDCGHWGRGRDAVIKMYGENDSTMGVSIHQVTNHLVDLVDANRATGIVYLIAEHQQHDGSWARLAGAYHDAYERQDGIWFIRHRRLLFWYRDSESLPAGVARDTTYRVFSKWPTLPDAWPTWAKFWSEHDVPASPHASIGRR